MQTPRGQIMTKGRQRTHHWRVAAWRGETNKKLSGAARARGLKLFFFFFSRFQKFLPFFVSFFFFSIHWLFCNLIFFPFSFSTFPYSLIFIYSDFSFDPFRLLFFHSFTQHKSSEAGAHTTAFCLRHHHVFALRTQQVGTPSPLSYHTKPARRSRRHTAPSVSTITIFSACETQQVIRPSGACHTCGRDRCYTRTRVNLMAYVFHGPAATGYGQR